MPWSRLHPANSQLEPLTVAASQVRVQGIFRGLLRPKPLVLLFLRFQNLRQGVFGDRRSQLLVGYWLASPLTWRV